MEPIKPAPVKRGACINRKGQITYGPSVPFDLISRLEKIAPSQSSQQYPPPYEPPHLLHPELYRNFTAKTVEAFKNRSATEGVHGQLRPFRVDHASDK